MKRPLVSKETRRRYPGMKSRRAERGGALSKQNSMNDQKPSGGTWTAYLKGVVFLGPPILIWTALMIFVVPKVKQICADAGAGPFTDWPFTVFGMLDFVQGNWMVMAAVLVAGVALLEWKSGLWRRWRNWTIGLAVFVINTAVIFGLASLLVVAAIVGPMLINR